MKTSNPLKTAIARWMKSNSFTYVPYEEFHSDNQIIEKKYGNYLVWSYDEDGIVEYRNIRSFYGNVMRDNSGRLFLSGNEHRTELQYYLDTPANIFEQMR